MFKENYKEKPKKDFLFDMDISNAVSAYDFTGAVPVPPKNEAEEESYREILNYSPKSLDVSNDKEKI